MIISVVMCTYNGEKYIEEQLRTIYRQNRKPDEVILMDDGSVDRTLALIRGFIDKYHLEETWHLYENKKNVGWKQNFMDAIQRATGDLIFLADQDDIWHPCKIKIMSSVMEQHSEINLLVCDCFPFDTDTGKRKKWFLPELGKQKLNRVSIGRSFAECLRPGCTYVLRSSMKEYIKELWDAEMPHDLFFWCLTLAQGSLYNCHKVLVKWRRAEGNSTPKNEKNRACRVEVLDRQYRITKRLLENKQEICISDTNRKRMQHAMRIYEQRKEAIRNSNYFQLMTMIRHIRSYPKNSSWVADLLAATR